MTSSFYCINNPIKTSFYLLILISSLSACASKKTLQDTQLRLDETQNILGMTEEELDQYKSKFQTCEGEKTQLQRELSLRQEQMGDLRKQIEDLKATLNAQITKVGDLTV